MSLASAQVFLTLSMEVAKDAFSASLRRTSMIFSMPSPWSEQRGGPVASYRYGPLLWGVGHFWKRCRPGPKVSGSFPPPSTEPNLRLRR
jgi:hypothetical protein